MTLTLTLTLTLTPTEIGTPFSSPVSLSGRVPLNIEDKLRAGLFERKTCETDAQIQACRCRQVPSRMHVSGCWREPIEMCQMLLNTTVTFQIRSATQNQHLL